MSELDAPDPIIAPSIRRRSEAEREADDVSFQALRNLGIEHTQALSGRVWTDYNLHDPGVTILEQVCYALTELAYRAELPVADHICGPDGTIPFERQALYRPNDILRCRPTTENDYRRVFLDAIKGLADARFLPEADDAAPRIPGLHRLSLRLADQHAAAEAVREAAHKARRIYRASRTLGEDLDETIVPVVPTFCTLSLTASISGMRDPADILAEVYRKCADRIAGLARVRSLGQLVRDDLPLDEILDGPLTHNGIIVEEDLPPETQDDLAAGALRELVLDVEGVIEVIGLEIAVEGARRADRHWAPSLRVPGDGSHEDDLEILSHVTFLRRGVRVPLDARAVASRHAHHFHPPLAAGSTHQEFDRLIRPPTGRFHPPEPFRSVQEDFPIIYGLGRRGAGGAGNSMAARTRVDQMKGYLTLFDQLLANTGEQIGHIRDLFAVEAPADRTYWRHILDDEDIPGVEAMRTAPSAAIAEAVYRPFDDAAERRGQVLDHLLALYGEALPQNTMRQFLDHLDSRELAAALVENKTEFLRHTLVLGRDRAAGFDTGVDLWKRPEEPGETEPTTGLQARVALLLGFRDWRARPLTARLAGAPGRRRGRGERRMPTAPAPPEPRPEQDASWALTWTEAPARTRAVTAALRRIARDPDLQAAVVAYAVARERFRWLPDAAGEGGRLLLTDTEENRRDLGAFASEGEAAELAQRLRRRMLRLNDVCDGLHVVEHILLRPRSAGAEAPDAAFYGLRVTFVFPAWTARTARRTFRRFAAETVGINAPAHVAADCLWLDFADMRQFEARFAAWTSRLRVYVRAESDETRTVAARNLDAASAELAAFLRASLSRQIGAEFAEPG